MIFTEKCYRNKNRMLLSSLSLLLAILKLIPNDNTEISNTTFIVETPLGVLPQECLYPCFTLSDFLFFFFSSLKLSSGYLHVQFHTPIIS